MRMNIVGRGSSNLLDMEKAKKEAQNKAFADLSRQAGRCGLMVTIGKTTFRVNKRKGIVEAKTRGTLSKL